MKYLKTYKLFESYDYYNLTDDIKDLVADLEDLGKISVYVSTTLDDKPIIIFQHSTANYVGKNLTFKFSDIDEYLFRIIRFLGKEKIYKISYLNYYQWNKFPVSLRTREIINLENDQDLDKIKSEKIVNLDIILK
jgi:hypothetical protein